MQATLQALATDPDYFSAFSLVVTAGLEEKSLQLLARRCEEANVPLLAARVAGFFGYLRLQVRNIL